MTSNIKTLAVLAERMPQLPISLRHLASPIVRTLRAIEAEPGLTNAEKIGRLESLRIPLELRRWAEDA